MARFWQIQELFRFPLSPGNKLDGEAVDAVAGVLFGKPLALKNVSEVTVAVIADDLDAAAVGVGNALDGTRYLVVEAGPAAAGGELVLAVVQGRFAAAADEDAVYLEVVILAGEGHLGAFTDDDALFLGGEGVVVFGGFHGQETAGEGIGFAELLAVENLLRTCAPAP